MEPESQAFLHPRQPLVPVAGAMLAGLLLATALPPQSWRLPTAAFLAGLALLTLARHRPRLRPALCLATTAAGAALLFHLSVKSFDPCAVERITPAADTWTPLTLRVQSTPEPDSGGGSGFLAEVLTVRGARASGLIQVRVDGGPAPRPGDLLSAAGLLGAPARARNPGQFDPSRYYAKQRVFRRLTVDAAGLAPAGPPAPAPLAQLASRVRDYMRRALGTGIDNDPAIASLIAGMVYGDKTSFDDATLERFRRTGTLHLFAVSGQNIGVLAAVALLLAPSLRLQRWRWGWVLIVPLGIYVLATGAQASALRAWTMAGLLLLAWRLDRPVSAMNVLAAAFLLALLLDPLAWQDTGFQLSFAVVFALAGLTPWLYRRLSRLGAPDPFLPQKLQPRWYREQHRLTRVGWAAVAASLAAGLGSAPLTAWHFHLAGWISPVINLVVVPLASCVAVIGAMSLSLFWASPALASLCNHANWLVAKTLLACVALADTVPGGAQHVARPADTWWSRSPRVTIMSVDDGQSILVETVTRAELFDTASRFRARQAVAPCLKARGVDRLDALWLSQGDADHAGGAAELARIWPVRAWLRPALPQRSPALQRFADATPRDPVHLVGPVTLARDSFDWDILWPGSEPIGASADERALVARLRWHAGPALLLAGDPSASLQRALLERNLPVRADVLVCGRPASGDELTDAFLDAVRPRHLVFHGGGYHDHALTPAELLRCRARGIAVWHLPDTGAVTIFCENGALRLRGFLRDAPRD